MTSRAPHLVALALIVAACSSRVPSAASADSSAAGTGGASSSTSSASTSGAGGFGGCADSIDCAGCGGCDDGNECTDDACTVTGCAHFPYDHTKNCDLSGKPGHCVIDNISEPLGVCCPGTTCLLIVDGGEVVCGDCAECDPLTGVCK